MKIQVTIPEILLLLAGIMSTVLGIIIFLGKTKLAEKKIQVGNFQFTNELIGFLLFLLGIILMLSFFVPVLGPRFSSPGMS